MSDPVSAAARALRETHEGSSPEAAATRRRILGEAMLRKRRHRAFAAVWMPLAAVLVVSSAWAAVTGRVAHLLAMLRGEARVTAMATPTSTPTSTPTTAPTSTTAPTPTSTTAPTPTSTTAPTPTSTPTPTLPPTPSDPEESLYSAAHHAHFVAHDPAVALHAWDDYLAAYPAGRFGLEARYNRALALVRLGRADEARVALTPFADGRSGGYRQTEARSLLDALDAGR